MRKTWIRGRSLTMSKLKVTNMRNVYFGCAVILLSIFGIVHTYIGGGWSKTTGEAAKMYPRIIYAILIIAALYLILIELMRKTKLEPPAIAVVKWWQVPVMLGIGVAFFYFVLYVGVIVGIFIYLFGFISLFDEDPKKHWKSNLIVTVVATVALWVIFNKVLPIVTVSQYLI